MNDSVDNAVSLASSSVPGVTLRGERERQGLSIAEVAATLKLTPRQIEAIEAGRFEDLPGFAFAKGFVRNYARLLHLDPQPLLAALEAPDDARLMELTPVSNAKGDMPQVGRGRFRRSVLPGVVAALALLSVVVVGWYYDSLRRKPAEELMASLPQTPPAVATPVEPPVPAVPPAGESAAAGVPAPVPVDGAAAVAAPAVPPASTAGTATPVPAVTTPAVISAAPLTESRTAEAKAPPAVEARVGDGASERLDFDFEQDAWVEVKDGRGKTVLSKLGQAGGRLGVEGQAPFTLVVGNARYVKLQRNGKPVDLAASTKVTVARLKLE